MSSELVAQTDWRSVPRARVANGNAALEQNVLATQASGRSSPEEVDFVEHAEEERRRACRGCGVEKARALRRGEERDAA